jgi:S1-C subfamily serine protease
MVISVFVLIFGFIGTCAAFIGETWRKDPKAGFLRRITSLGWAAIISLTVALTLQIMKEVHASRERDQLEIKLDDTTKALSQIASSRESGSQARGLAANSLDRSFNLYSPAVVKVKAIVDGKLREKSGFFVNSSGYVLTSDFAVANADGASTLATQVGIETIDGRTHPARIVKLTPDLSIAVLRTQAKNDSYLDLANRPPISGEQLLVIGFTPEDFLTRAIGNIFEVGDIDGLYLRDRHILQGFGGGPILDQEGSVIGLNWGALVPPIPGRARLIRADRIRQHLETNGFL